MKSENVLRQRILDAALDIVEEQGIAALTQPKVAKAAGVRQSHLTYYFPRKADLYIALLEASHVRARRKEKPPAAVPASRDWGDEIAALVLDRRRMQFFLGIILAASEDPDLSRIVADHMEMLPKKLATIFGRSETDPAVLAFVDQLRGLGLRTLVQGESLNEKAPDLITELAHRNGLEAPRKR